MNNNEFKEEVIDIVDENTASSNQIVDKGPWKVFAVIGHVFGIVSLVSLFIPFFSFGVAVDGIIMSALGKKSTTKREKAKKGLTMNIVACAVNFVYSMIMYGLLVFLMFQYA